MHGAKGPDRRARRMFRSGLALLVSSLLPVQQVAASDNSAMQAPKGKSTTVSRWPTGIKDPAAKIHGSVSKAFAAQAEVSYFVQMQERADVLSTAKAARQSAEPARRETSARAAVMQTLKETAERSQRSLLTDLEKERARGSVSKVECFWIANLCAVTSSKDVMHKVARRADVARILPNSEIRLIGGGANTGAATADAPSTMSIEWNIERVGAPLVWSQFGINGTGTVVASLDTGVEWTHPALQQNWRGYDPGSGSTNAAYSWFDAVNNRSMPYDDHGHGTHTTGTAVGREPDGANQIGVAPGARWIAAKILNSAGNGTSENILRAGQWILAPGGDPNMAPDVVNNSWGGDPGIDEWFRDVVTAWRAAGIVPVFASGNDGPGNGTVSSPGNYPEAITVGATDINDNLAGFSSRGSSPYGEIKPELSAPGVNVRSSVPGGGYEGGWNGTSMATPHVSGAVALLRSADASLTVDHIEEILVDSAEPKTNSQYTSVPNNGYGHGILDTYTAVGMVVSGVGTVSGRVVTGGDDLEPPVIQHTAVTESYKYTPITVDAGVSDNVSVTSVQLRFRMPGMTWWGVVDMERSSGDFKSGTYTGTIPADMAQAATVEYYIEAMDYGGNNANSGTAANPHAVTLLNGITPGYRMDFEANATGWTHAGENDSWQIGEPSSGPGSAHSGTKVAATNLAGDYANETDAFLLTPPIDLSGGPTGLRFWHWYNFEQGFDKGFVLATGDGGQNWTILSEHTGAGTAWQEKVLDLSAFAGNPSVYVAFYVLSDTSVTRPGWYIDDFELYVDTEAPGAPANLGAQATPAGSVALTWDAVTAADLGHYTVYRSSTSGSGYQPIGEANTNSFVDAQTTSGSTYYYVVSATDIFGNEGPMSGEATVTTGGLDTRFSDDMESGAGAWTHSGINDPWQLGAPTSGPGSARSGANVWATNLSGNYASGTNASLVTPPVDLSGLAAASLQFAHWYSLERNFDFARVEISTNGGGSWTQLAAYTSPASGGAPVGWEQPLIDLTPYVGQTVQIRFRIQSDGSVNYAGWYIDDVVIAGSAAGGTSVSLPMSTATGETTVSAKGKPPEYAPHPTLFPSKQTSKSDVQPSQIGVQSLPLDATVTVLETGRVVRTNPANGAFSLTLPAGTFTLRGEAYGYYPQEKSVTVTDGAITNVILQLEAIPHGQVSGTVTDTRTGAPLAGVQVSVAEDPRIAPVTTGTDGHYTLEVLAGHYTVQARAMGYYPASASVDVPGNGAVTADLSLRPFVGMPGEIAYDDGTAENAWGFYAAGNGWAVRMSPTGPGQTVVVNAARFFLWDSTWPSPGGNTIQAAIYAANADGTPGALLAGPVLLSNAVRGGWNDVDFSQYGLTVQGDFYVAVIQDQPYPNTPGMAADESSADSGRNWQLVDGAWSPWADGGNIMIRAAVSNAVDAPLIISPASGTFTNQAQQHITGWAAAGTTVTLFVNGSQAAQVGTDNKGNWAADITLTEGTNLLTATATVSGGGTTDPSKPLTITLDTAAPALNLSSPSDGAKQTGRIITVTGTATDVNLTDIKVNSVSATIQEGGAFTVELIGQEGANPVTVIATDRAGNQTTVMRTVHIDTGAPALTNIAPATDTTLAQGDTLTVAFDSEPGLALAAFQIVLDASGQGATGGAGAASLEPGEVAMTEVSAGHYEGSWTVPAGFSASRALVKLSAVDVAGNATRVTAPGALQVLSSAPPTAVIKGPNTGRTGDKLRYDGSGSRDSDGSIVRYEWDFGDGAFAEGRAVTHQFSQAGTYMVKLTVTDNSGVKNSATMSVQITSKKK